MKVLNFKGCFKLCMSETVLFFPLVVRECFSMWRHSLKCLGKGSCWGECVRIAFHLLLEQKSEWWETLYLKWRNKLVQTKVTVNVDGCKCVRQPSDYCYSGEWRKKFNFRSLSLTHGQLVLMEQIRFYIHVTKYTTAQTALKGWSLLSCYSFIFRFFLTWYKNVAVISPVCVVSRCVEVSVLILKAGRCLLLIFISLAFPAPHQHLGSSSVSILTFFYIWLWPFCF